MSHGRCAAGATATWSTNWRPGHHDQASFRAWRRAPRLNVGEVRRSGPPAWPAGGTVAAAGVREGLICLCRAGLTAISATDQTDRGQPALPGRARQPPPWARRGDQEIWSSPLWRNGLRIMQGWAQPRRVFIPSDDDSDGERKRCSARSSARRPPICGAANLVDTRRPRRLLVGRGARQLAGLSGGSLNIATEPSSATRRAAAIAQPSASARPRCAMSVSRTMRLTSRFAACCRPSAYGAAHLRYRPHRRSHRGARRLKAGCVVSRCSPPSAGDRHPAQHRRGSVLVTATTSHRSTSGPDDRLPSAAACAAGQQVGRRSSGPPRPTSPAPTISYADGAGR